MSNKTTRPADDVNTVSGGDNDYHVPASPLVARVGGSVSSSWCNSESLKRIVSLQGTCPLGLPHRLWVLYFEVFSLTATGIIFIQLFPFWIAMGHTRVTNHLSFCMTFGQYFTSVFKDTFCLARPPSPPVWKKGVAKQKLEYGFPSGHTSGALLLAYCNGRFIHEIYGVSPLLLWLAAFLYIVQVGLSRVYLGMHWPIDVLAGLGIGTAIAACHSMMGFDHIIDDVLSASSWEGRLFVCLVFYGLARIHPIPRAACPCYLDSLRFLGAGLGMVIGNWIWGHEHFATDGSSLIVGSSSLPMVLLTAVLLMVIMVIAEVLAKPLFEALLKKIILWAATKPRSEEEASRLSVPLRAWIIGLLLWKLPSASNSSPSSKKRSISRAPRSTSRGGSPLNSVETDDSDDDDRYYFSVKLRHHWTEWYGLARFGSHTVFALALYYSAPRLVPLLA